MNAILSIKPQFVKEILVGTKKFEFRKTFFKQPVSRVFVYASAPVSKIVGEFHPSIVVAGAPEDVWRWAGWLSGISKETFDEYYKGRNIAYAIWIENFLKYSYPVDLPKGTRAPQNYCYVKTL